MNNTTDIQALILAAGKSTRLYPYTLDIPKPLLCIKEIPILTYILREVTSVGIEDVVVTVDYLKEKIIDYYKDSLHYLYTPHGTMIDGIFLAAQQSKHEAFLGLSGDTLITRDSLRFALSEYLQKQPDAVLLLNTSPNLSGKKWKYQIGNDDTLEDIIISEDQTFTERTALILKREAIAKVTNFRFPFTIDDQYQKYSSGWNLLLKLMIDHKLEVKAYFTDFPVHNINTFEAYLNARKFVEGYLPNKK